ncbi:MAG: redoxin family protein [Chthonomonas sp.]|nr:redoxin family protein [Chthonomonas sp.]
MGVLSYLTSVTLLTSFSALTAQQAIEGFTKEYQALQTAKNLTEETYYGAAEKFGAQVDFNAISVDEGIQLSGHAIGMSPSGYAGLVGFANKQNVTNDEGGLKAATLKAMVSVIESRDGKTMSSADVNKSFGTLLGHSMVAPNRQVIMAVYNGSSKLDSKNFSLYGDLVSRGVDPTLASMAFGSWQEWVDANPGHKDTDKLWTKFHDGAVLTLTNAEKMEKPDARVVSGLKRTISGMESPAGKGKLVGFPAPEITFKWDSGGKTKLSDYKGNVVVLDFWATWCGPCLASMPHIRELANHYKGKKVVILGVTSIQDGFWEDGKKQDLKGKPNEEIALYPEYMKRKDINWTIAVGDQNVFNPDYGVNGIPHMAILDAQGKIRYRGLHPSGVSLAEKIKMIDPLLAEIK